MLEEAPKTNSVQEAFQPAFEEISRRASAALQNTGEAVAAAKLVEATELPLPDGQEWALISVGTAVLAPRPVERAHPALRVYGAFETSEDAAEHGTVVSEIDPSCSQIRLQLGRWFMMPQTHEALEDTLGHEARMKERLREHWERRRQEQERFDEAVRAHAEHEQRACAAVQWSEEDEATEEAEQQVYRPPRRLRAGAEVRGQSAVVLSVIPDRTGEGECIFCVLGCHERSADAHAWVQKVVSEYAVTSDLVVATTCDWLYPNATDRTTNEHYRNAELQKIMDAAKNNKAGVRRYKEWQNEQAGAAVGEPRLTS